jgi:hypothetical protein
MMKMLRMPQMMRDARLLCATIALAKAMASEARADVAVLVGAAEDRVTEEPNPARVNEPFAVAFDADGRMYGVEYTRGNRLFRIAADGAVKFVAGKFHVSKPGDVFPPDRAIAAADAQLHGSHGVAIGRNGLVYVADTFNHRIRAFDPATGTVSTVAGTGVAGFSGDGRPAVAAAFNQAYCGALVPDGRSLLVADLANARLRRIDLDSRLVATIAGNGGKGKPLDGAAALDTPLAGPRAALTPKKNCRGVFQPRPPLSPIVTLSTPDTLNGSHMTRSSSCSAPDRTRLTR